MENEEKKEVQAEKEPEFIITGEQAFDMLPAIGRLYEKLDLTKCVTDLQKKFNAAGGKDKETFLAEKGGLNEIIKHITKNMSKVKEEFFEIVGIAAGISPDEAKKRNYGYSLKVFKAIFSDKDLTDFFKSAMQ